MTTTATFLDHPRDIYSRGNSEALRNLIQSVFVTECLVPSRSIWMVSAWISDIEILDNRSGQFSGVAPTWAHSWVRLSSVLATLLQSGCAITVITNTSEHNKPFRRAMEQINRGNRYKFRYEEVEGEHEKGIVTDKCLIDGSMNFTYNGIFINREHVIYRTRVEDIALRRVTLAGQWGAPNAVQG